MVLSTESASGELTIEKLLDLGRFDAGPCVSIYTPLVTAGPQVRQNKIRLSNQLKLASERLQQAGVDTDEASQILKPLADIGDSMSDSPPAHPGSGMVSFLSASHNEIIPVPAEPSESVFVGPRFITRHLLPSAGSPSRVHVLSLSLGEAKFYAMGRGQVEEIRPEDMPGNLAELTAYEDPEKSVQQHSAGGDAIFHGHGASSDSGEETEHQYIRRVADAIDRHLADANAPLMLAATDEMFTDFCRYSQYSNIVDQPITGNVEHLSETQLRDQVWEQIDQISHRQQSSTTQRFLGLASEAPDNVIRGVIPSLQQAYQGNADRLIFPSTLESFGVFDGETGEAVEKSGADDDQLLLDDLVDLAAMFALQHGGSVTPIIPADQGEADQLPQEMLVVLRNTRAIDGSE